LVNVFGRIRPLGSEQCLLMAFMGRVQRTLQRSTFVKNFVYHLTIPRNFFTDYVMPLNSIGQLRGSKYSLKKFLGIVKGYTKFLRRVDRCDVGVTLPRGRTPSFRWDCSDSVNHRAHGHDKGVLLWNVFVTLAYSRNCKIFGRGRSHL
jgi:hypothetical protein